MDAKSCVIFLKAAETGSITKAALALGYTQYAGGREPRRAEDRGGVRLSSADTREERRAPHGRWRAAAADYARDSAVGRAFPRDGGGD